MASSSSRHDSRALSASSSSMSLSSTEWDGDETGLNTGFFETSDSDLEIFTDASEQRKEPEKNVLKKISQKKEFSSSSGSDSSSDDDTKKKTSTPMKKYSISQMKQGLQNFLRDFSVEPSTKDPTSSGDEKPTAKKMKIEETVKIESKSSSEHKLKLLAENNDHLQDTLRRRNETVKGLNKEKLQLLEKLKKISKTQDAFVCIICFDSVSIWSERLISLGLR